jgi:hypothetical protein
MAVQLTATDQYLLRSDAYLDTTNAFTIAMWFRQGSTTPSGSEFRTAYNYGDPNGVNPYLYLGSDTDTDDLVIAYWDGSSYVQSSVHLPTDLVYEYIAMVYDGGTAFKFYVDGVLIDTLTIDISAISFVEVQGDISGSWNDFGFGYVGVWQAALSSGQLNAQAQSATPLTTALSFTPLSSPSDLTDSTGNGHDWTVTGSLAFVVDPWNAFITQIATEVLGNVTAPEAVVTQVAAEILGNVTAPEAIVTQIAIEILREFQCESAPANLRCTQIPIEAAYDYGIMRPFIKSGGRAWLTPPPTPTI